MMIDKALISAEAAQTSSPAQIGGKAWQLGQLRRYGLPVPDFFVIAAPCSAQRQHGPDPALLDQLAAELARRGWLNQPLAVRSSAVGEDAAEASFAGIFRSHLNVRGLAALQAALIDIWASLDSPVASAYRQRLGIAAEMLMAVIVIPL